MKPNEFKEKEPPRIELGFKATDDEIIELVNVDNFTQFCIYDRKTGMFRIEPEITVGNVQIVPPFMRDPLRGGELVRKGVVLLAEKPEEYGNEKELLNEIIAFIHYFADVGDFYEKFSAYYTMFTWLYDLFNTLPYPRLLGDFGTGKTRYLSIMGAICYRGMITGGATTSSPIFRIVDAYRGTLVLDEANFRDSDMYNDLIKILNFGFEKGKQILRTEDIGGKLEPRAYDCYGPKIIGARVPFKDEATESRCLTHFTRGTLREDIPLLLGPEFWERAKHLRNKLLMWRLRNYGKKFELDFNRFKEIQEARVKQITIPLMAIIDDEDAKKEIEKQVYDYWQQLISARTETFEYDVLTALQTLWSGEKVRPKTMADILNVDRDKKDKVRPERVGRLLRGMGFKSQHDREGSIVTKDEALFASLKRKYGVTDDVTVQIPAVTAVTHLEKYVTDDRCDSTYEDKGDSSDSIIIGAVKPITLENSPNPPLTDKKPSNRHEKQPSELSQPSLEVEFVQDVPYITFIGDPAVSVGPFKQGDKAKFPAQVAILWEQKGLVRRKQ